MAILTEGGFGMINTLYIIGNHGIQSSYKAFGEYLKCQDRNTYAFVERYFGVDGDFWAEFEERLASFDTDTLIDNASNVLVSYAVEDWKDAYHHDYQFDIEQAVKAISKTLRSRFEEWVRQLHIPDPSHINASVRLPIDQSATFLNFNYTPSLQRLYGVPNDRVLHIHGAAADPDARLVLGHGWEPQKNLDPYRFAGVPEDADIRVVEGQSIIDSYFRDTFKPTAQIIQDNEAFFAGLSHVERIFVMGHSVSIVDHPYFRKVIRNIDACRVKWKISYFDGLNDLRERVKQLGIDQYLVEFALLADFK
jgi:hypothetical protein